VNAEQKKQPKEPLKIDLPFEETLAAMLQVAPEVGAKKPPIKKPAAKKKAKKAKT
jgi:hypothetical protein